MTQAARIFPPMQTCKKDIIIIIIIIIIITIIIIIIIIIIQYLYSALKCCKGYRGAGGFRLRLFKQVCFEVF